MTERWHTVALSDGGELLVQRGNVVVGTIILKGNRWHVEVLWSGPSGDIKGNFSSELQALAFVEGVEKAMAAFRELVA